MKGFDHFLRITSCRARNESDAIHFLPEHRENSSHLILQPKEIPMNSDRMKGIRLLSMICSVWIGFDHPAYAGQPLDQVSSDGNFNTAMGASALLNMAASSFGNTAAGDTALGNLGNGSFNSAFGARALANATSGGGNSAFGYGALYLNQDGVANTATGYHALFNNVTTANNTAVGYQALFFSTAEDNTAVGFNALVSNIGGSYNTAVGSSTLLSNQSGAENTAVGFNALGASTGNGNIGIGVFAGVGLESGSNNIDIGNEGSSGDSAVIRIGTAGVQKEAFLAGVENSKVTGAAVYVTSSGRLGVLASSERYKTDIESLGKTTQRLEQLRPVRFHLKSDPGGTIQYGLIAEEVDKVYPELVIRDDKGVIQGVRYDELAPLLLNLVQQQNAAMRTQAKDLAAVRAEAHAAKLQLEAVQLALAKFAETNREMQAELSQMKVRDARVAMR